ncbi:MAG: hypothetical protein NBV67_03860 [Tagaea sp.]|nr:hypothetical protein [Tagaea sp.]
MERSDGQETADGVPDGADPRIVAFHRYWRSIAPAPGVLPGRRHFDPIDIPALLPFVWLLDIVGRPPRFRYRLLGTSFSDEPLLGATGKFMDDLAPDFAISASYADYMAAATTGAVRWRRGLATYAYMPGWRRIERVLMPLAADGKTPDIVAGLTLVHERERS